MGQVNVVEDLLFSQAAGNGFTARCLPSMDRERPKPPADTSTTHQAALDTIADMRELVIRRRAVISDNYFCRLTTTRIAGFA